MRALICAASLLGLLCVVALTSGPVGAQDDEKPTIKQIMAKLHKGAQAPLKGVQGEMKKETPDWAKVEANAIIIDKFGAYLPKTKAPKGEQADYEKLANAYAKSAKSLRDAAEDKELTKAKDATKKLGASCKSCHSAHREN